MITVFLVVLISVLLLNVIGCITTFAFLFFGRKGNESLWEVVSTSFFFWPLYLYILISER